MNDHQKLKALLKDLGLNYYDIARITGLTYDSIKNQLQPKKKIPSWVHLVLYVYLKMKRKLITTLSVMESTISVMDKSNELK